jgi:acetyl esterase/lipase
MAAVGPTPASDALYPGHLSLAENSIALNPDIRTHITPQTSPTFLLQNEDDDSDRVEDSLSYYVALKKAGVPVEMHLYAQGGHGFGLRRTRFPVTAWPQLVETWLGRPAAEQDGGASRCEQAGQTENTI